MTKINRWLVLLAATVMLAGCGGKDARPFDIKNLGKSDIDLVTDAHIRELKALTRELTIKLYKRNPVELSKAPAGMTVEKRLFQLFSTPKQQQFDELNNRYGNDAIELLFDENYTGDRVFALMTGLVGMLHKSYNEQEEFFLLDSLDQQKIYNSARNIEVVAWRLSNRKKADGTPFLLTNGIDEHGIVNYSYERMFGKLISLQDMMATLVADGSNRAINRVVHGAASMTLLPI